MFKIRSINAKSTKRSKPHKSQSGKNKKNTNHQLKKSFAGPKHKFKTLRPIIILINLLKSQGRIYQELMRSLTREGRVVNENPRVSDHFSNSKMTGAVSDSPGTPISELIY
jgi:hypothetical protein